jgi:hypothetical protein
VSKRVRTPEQKRRHAEEERRRRTTPEGKRRNAEIQKRCRSTPKSKLRIAKYNKTYHTKLKLEQKAVLTGYQKKRRQTPQYKEYRKEFRKRPESKAKHNEYQREWRKKSDNLEKEKARHQRWNKNNPQKVRATNQRFRLNNPQACRRKFQTWYLRNPHYVKHRRASDLAYKIKSNLRSRVSGLIQRAIDGAKSKQSRTLELLCCDVDWLMAWIEIQFLPQMTWENYGRSWHIDHVRPCASFDLTDLHQQKLCFHWTNLQPLLVSENLKKGDKWNETSDHRGWPGTSPEELKAMGQLEEP